MQNDTYTPSSICAPWGYHFLCGHQIYIHQPPTSLSSILGVIVRDFQVFKTTSFSVDHVFMKRRGKHTRIWITPWKDNWFFMQSVWAEFPQWWKGGPKPVSDPSKCHKWHNFYSRRPSPPPKKKKLPKFIRQVVTSNLIPLDVPG